MVDNYYKYVFFVFCIGASCFTKQNLYAQDIDSIILFEPRDTSDLNDTSRVFTTTLDFSRDSLDAPVFCEARDSQEMNMKEEKIYLYGNAQVKHNTLTLNADIIIFDWGKNEVTALHSRDSLGKIVGLPHFADKGQEFDAKEIRYNFKSKKGKIKEIGSTYDNLYIHGEETKIFNNGEIGLNKDAIFTTCNHPIPHYGIRSKKQKVVKDKLVIIGQSQLEIMGIKTPLWLPFGFFPVTAEQTSGILFTPQYEFSDAFGFGLQNFGYYQKISEYADLSLTGDIYTRGTWRTRANYRYRKRYNYSGSLNFTYNNLITELDESVDPLKTTSFSIDWAHNQDAKAHPTQKFGGSVRFQSNNANRDNRFDYQSQVTGTTTSNLNYSKTFANTPFSLTSSLGVSQNTTNRKVDVNFPNLKVKMNRIFPFKKETGGKEKWYEKIGVNYDLRALARASGTDSTFFQQETIDNLAYGVEQSTSTSLPLKVFKYFNLNTSATYKETWFFKTIDKTFDDETTYLVDTLWNADSSSYTIDQIPIDYGTVNTDTVNGFKALRQYSLSTTLQTRIFSTLKFKRGFLRGLRLDTKPSVTLSFQPNYKSPNLGYYKTVDTDNRPAENVEEEYSIFRAGNLFNGPSGNGNLVASYSLNSFLEGKFATRDTLEPTRKLKLLNSVNISGNYDFFADTLNWSKVNMTANTSLFKGITSVQFSASFDPYNINESGRRVNALYKDDTGKLLRFSQASLTLNNSLRFSEIVSWFTGEKEKNSSSNKNGSATARAQSDGGSSRGGKRGEQTNQSKTNQAFISNLSINHNIKFVFYGQEEAAQRDTDFDMTANSIRLSGDVNLSDKWAMRLGNISYDFKNDKMVYPSLSLTRDLHCWEMGISWYPQFGAYQFYIKVKDAPLDFLNLPYKKNQWDQDSFL